MKILVTGATGFLGSKIVAKLLKQGEDLKLFIRNKKKLSPDFKDLEIIQGDLTDSKILEQSLEGCDRVIHTAGLISTFPKDEQLLYQINYEVSRNLFQLALEKGITKFVYTSSTSCLGGYRNPDWTAFVKPDQLNVPYVTSKLKGLESALEFNKKGLPIVILLPTMLLGEGDYNLNTTELVYSFLKKRIPGYLNGGVNPVDVEDVALAHVNALTLGRNGVQYIIGGDTNLSIKDLFLELEILSGVKAPKLMIPTWLGKTMGLILQSIMSDAKLNLSAIKMGSLYWYFNNDKMKQELQIKPTPLATTLQKSIDWVKNVYNTSH